MVSSELLFHFDNLLRILFFFDFSQYGYFSRTSGREKIEDLSSNFCVNFTAKHLQEKKELAIVCLINLFCDLWSNFYAVKCAAESLYFMHVVSQKF